MSKLGGVAKGIGSYATKQVKQQAMMSANRVVDDVVNSHHRAYNFYVEINGIGFSFSKVSGLERSNSMEEFHEGGYNGYSHRMRNHDQGQHVLTLEYGSTTTSFILDSLEPGRYLPKGVYVTSLSHDSWMSGKTFELDGCYVQKISFGDYDAERSSLVINRMEIVYSTLTMPSIFG